MPGQQEDVSMPLESFLSEEGRQAHIQKCLTRTTAAPRPLATQAPTSLGASVTPRNSAVRRLGSQSLSKRSKSSNEIGLAALSFPEAEGEGEEGAATGNEHSTKVDFHHHHHESRSGSVTGGPSTPWGSMESTVYRGSMESTVYRGSMESMVLNAAAQGGQAGGPTASPPHGFLTPQNRRSMDLPISPPSYSFQSPAAQPPTRTSSTDGMPVPEAAVGTGETSGSSSGPGLSRSQSVPTGFSIGPTVDRLESGSASSAGWVSPTNTLSPNASLHIRSPMGADAGSTTLLRVAQGCIAKVQEIQQSAHHARSHREKCQAVVGAALQAQLAMEQVSSKSVPPPLVEAQLQRVCASLLRALGLANTRVQIYGNHGRASKIARFLFSGSTDDKFNEVVHELEVLTKSVWNLVSDRGELPAEVLTRKRIRRGSVYKVLSVRTIACVAGGTQVWYSTWEPHRRRLVGFDVWNQVPTVLPGSVGMGTVSSIAADGCDRVWTGHTNGDVHMWDADRGETLCGSRAFKSSVMAMAVVAPGVVWAGSEGGNVRVLATDALIEDDTVSLLATLDAGEGEGGDARSSHRGHTGRVRAILAGAVSPYTGNCTRVWSAGGQGVGHIRSWDAQSKRMVWSNPCGDLGQCNVLALVSTAEDERAHRSSSTSLRGSRESFGRGDEGRAGRSSGGGEAGSDAETILMVSGHKPGHIQIWEGRTGAPLARIGHSSSACKSLVEVGPLFCAAREDGDLAIYPTQFLREASRWAHTLEDQSFDPCLLKAHKTGLCFAVGDNNAEGLVTVGRSGAIVVWPLAEIQMAAHSSNTSDVLKVLPQASWISAAGRVPSRTNIGPDSYYMQLAAASFTADPLVRLSSLTLGHQLSSSGTPAGLASRARSATAAIITGGSAVPRGDQWLDGGDFWNQGKFSDELSRSRRGNGSGGGSYYDDDMGSVNLEGELRPPGSLTSTSELGISGGERSSMAPVDEWQLEYSDIKLRKSVGQGGFGQVHLATWRCTEVAVKMLAPGSHNVDGDLIKDLKSESSIMNSLRHPNIVMFMGFCMDPPCIVTEYCSRGSLWDVLSRHKKPGSPPLEWTRRVHMALGAAKGMWYLHTNQPPVIHRDLKSPNLLVDQFWKVKVCDFNLSRVMDKDTMLSSTAVHSPCWLAPEVLKGEEYNTAADVYSFGVIMWELLTLQQPWEDMSPWQVMHAVVEEKKRPEVPAELPNPDLQAFVDVMEACWAGDPSARPTFEVVIRDLQSLLQVLARKSASNASVSPPAPAPLNKLFRTNSNMDANAAVVEGGVGGEAEATGPAKGAEGAVDAAAAPSGAGPSGENSGGGGGGGGGGAGRGGGGRRASGLRTRSAHALKANKEANQIRGVKEAGYTQAALAASVNAQAWREEGRRRKTDSLEGGEDGAQERQLARPALSAPAVSTPEPALVRLSGLVNPPDGAPGTGDGEGKALDRSGTAGKVGVILEEAPNLPVGRDGAEGDSGWQRVSEGGAPSELGSAGGAGRPPWGPTGSRKGSMGDRAIEEAAASYIGSS